MDKRSIRFFYLLVTVPSFPPKTVVYFVIRQPTHFLITVGTGMLVNDAVNYMVGCVLTVELKSVQILSLLPLTFLVLAVVGFGVMIRAVFRIRIFSTMSG